MNEDTRKRMASSKSEHWCTPLNVLEKVRLVNEIALDPCSNPYSIVDAMRAVSLPENGLEVDWYEESQRLGGLVFVNPPYGKKTKDWTRKCVEEAEKGTEIIALVGSRTETIWFQKDILQGTASGVCFWKGRLKFIDGTGQGCTDPAFFPSAVAYWGDNSKLFTKVFRTCGWTIRKNIE